MSRTNKYASLNFNEVFEKKNNNKPSSTSSPSSSSASNPQSTHLSTARTHGGMLVLTRTSPKPHTQPQPHPQISSPPPPPPLSPPSKLVSDGTHFDPDSISLRPLGRTGSSSFSSSPSSNPSVSLTLERDRETPLSLTPAKPEPFVPPHLRHGFAGREERLDLDGQRNQGFRSRDNGQGHFKQQNSPSRYGEDGRPKSGGQDMRRGADSDPLEVNRPSSGGNRQSSGGGYGSYRSPPHF